MTFYDILHYCVLGYTKKEIAEKFYYSPDSVKLRIRKVMTNEEFKEIVEQKRKQMYLDGKEIGLSDAIISKKMRMSKQTLINKKKKWGIL